MEDLLEEWLSAPAAYPEARCAIEALDPIVREELSQALEPIALHAGETLFTCGDPRDAAFLILSGRISLAEPGSEGGDPAGPCVRCRGGGGRDRPGGSWPVHRHGTSPRRRQGLAAGQDRFRGAV